MDNFIAQMMAWAPNFAPKGWAFCQGQLLPISTNTALFSIIGTIYGGDGRTTFALPDLRGRTTVAYGRGSGLSDYRIGEETGTEFVTLITPEMPSHNHMAVFTPSGGSATTASVPISSDPADHSDYAAGRVLAAATTSSTTIQGRIYTTDAPDQVMPATVTGGGGGGGGTVTIGVTGGNQSHENRMPFQVVNYCIALQGIFPSRG